MGKPVVVSNCQPLERIVKNTGCGIVFNSGNSKELANSILLLYNNPELREEYGICGREAVYSRYNWELESKKLTSLYNSLRDKSE
jgi:glycosyltransferase involved in cell wall biosynthesis